MRAGDALEGTLPYLSSLFYGDIPCLYWPTAGEVARPAPLAAADIPTLVLGATADPATPVENGEAVYSRLEDGYLITTQGGAHVIFGRGDACPDEIVTAFLVDGTRPEEREIMCEGIMFTPYEPVAPRDAAAFPESPPCTHLRRQRVLLPARILLLGLHHNHLCGLPLRRHTHLCRHRKR